MTHPSSDPAHTPQQDLDMMRALRRKRLAENPKALDHGTFGQRVADRVAMVVGSWRFIIVQSVLLVIWIILNTLAWLQHWDPYPFILMNLALSFQAAYTAPMIMMSQNRLAEIDRRNAAYDFEINLRAEHEIKALHAKINLLQIQLDQMRSQDLGEMNRLLRELHARTDQPHSGGRPAV